MSTEPRKVVLWKSSSCPPAYQPTESGGCLRKAQAIEGAKPKTEDEKNAEIRDLMQRLIAGATLLSEKGSPMDGARECLASHRGAELAAKLRDLGYVVDARSLAQAVAAGSR